MGNNDRTQNAREEASAARRARDRADAQWRGYVNVVVSDALKAQFDDWARTDEPWVLLGELATSGCVVSVKAGSDAGTFLATITQRTAGHVNAGLCISARAGEAGKALFRALFCVSIMGPDPDWSAFGRVADPDRW